VVGKTTRPIRARDAKRMDTISLFCGCLPCLLLGHLDVHTTVEHVTEAGRRVGGDEQHQHTIGLCPWHHFGKGRNGWSRQQLTGEFGPPLIYRKAFEDFFGDEVTVLIPIQNFVLELFDRKPWPEYAIPRDVARKVRIFWIDKNAAPSRYIVQS
jgi:hypothetical protein